MLQKLSNLPKTSSFTSKLSADPQVKTPTEALSSPLISKPRILESGAFCYTLPEKRKSYKYLTSSENALKDLGLDQDEVTSLDFQSIVSGQYYHDPKFMESAPFPYSMCYAGFQFGQFAGQLGDGRVVNLFEIPKSKADNSMNRNKYELQLKGAGMTPFSRFADGKAVLRSSIREYIISEHLNAIGIATTRALSLVFLPDTLARRYMPEKCAIVSRFAELWIRLGTFDLHRWRGDREGLKQLCDYCIEELFTVGDQKFPYFSQLMKANDSFTKDFDTLSDYDKLFFEVIIRNALGTAKWQSYGFLNGVLNTDNTSILGLSMDYGPFSIMDKFKPTYTPNSEDHELRYSYSNTPTAIWWNLTRFGEDMAELIGMGGNQIDESNITESEELIVKRATAIIESGRQIYMHCYTKNYVESFYNRLGLSTDLVDSKNPNKQNQEIISPLLEVLEKIECDFNNFFVELQSLDFDSKTMDIKQIATDLAPDSHDVLSATDMEEFLAGWLSIYQKELAKSENLGFERSSAKQYNPLFLPRNWILDEVIDKTQSSNGDNLEYLKKLEKMAFNPYDKSKWGQELKDVESRWTEVVLDDVYTMQQCSCSS